MAKPEKYRLQVLLTIREKNKRVSEIALSKSIRHLKNEELKLEELKEEKEALVKKREEYRLEMSQTLSTGRSVVRDSSVYINYLRKMDEDILDKEQEVEDQAEEVERAKQAVKDARQDYIDACQALQVMQKHRELWLKKQKRQITMQEDKQLGELANVIHQIKAKA